MNRISILMVTFASIFTMLHGGGTDGNGGHYVGGSGDYHYHHGYPAHDHYDIDGDGFIDCPYNFDDQSDHKASEYETETETNNSQVVEQNKPNETERKITFKDFLGSLLAAIVILSCPIIAMLICLFGAIAMIFGKVYKMITNKELKFSLSDKAYNVINVVVYLVVVAVATAILLLK